MVDLHRDLEARNITLGSEKLSVQRMLCRESDTDQVTRIAIRIKSLLSVESSQS
jgi:hypothetical protein